MTMSLVAYTASGILVWSISRHISIPVTLFFITVMRRIRDRGESESTQNFAHAWETFSKGKHSRRDIQIFEDNLEENLSSLREQLERESWNPHEYTSQRIFAKKERILAKAPVEDHVLEAAAILPYEKALYDYIAWQSPAVRPGMGNQALLKSIRNELFKNRQDECYYYFAIDAHHYFPLMDHALLKEAIDRKVKRGKLRTHLYKVVDSYQQGAPLGIKTAQIFGQIYLARFDRSAMDIFGVMEDKEKMAYWTDRFVTDKICTARTRDDYDMLCRGPGYMAGMFRNYMEEGLQHYSRFVDNIIVRHKDKTFLHIILEMFAMVLSRDYHVILNKDYNVRPVHMGIRVCGYVFYHDRVEVSRANKKRTAKHIHRLKKRGHDEEYIRLHTASQLGYIQHADTIHLIKSLGMEKTLGSIIKRRRIQIPFEGMRPSQKVKFSDISSPLEEEQREEDVRLLLLDYRIMPSKLDSKTVKRTISDPSGETRTVEKKEAGDVLVIKFKIIEDKLQGDGDEEYYICRKETGEEGRPSQKDAQYFCYTGSEVLIDQARCDFSTEDLPCPTVIREFRNKNGQKYYRFT